MTGVDWRYLEFDALSGAELYAVLRLRSEVFVVEQTCIFQDIDGADVHAMHLLGTSRSVLVAYARCFVAGGKFPQASIGRIVTHSCMRGKGLGHALVEKAVSHLSASPDAHMIKIGAQSRLASFYRQHGFEPTGVPYIEDGIEHIEMLRSARLPESEK